MKTTPRLPILLAFAFFTLAGFSIQAQDIITMRNGEQIKARNIEIEGTIVKYKKFESPEGATYSKYTKDVAKITYENGDVEQFSGSNGGRSSYAVAGRNLLGYNYFDLTTLNFSFIYERILTEDNTVSLYVPVRIGFAQNNSYLERPNNYGVGLGIFVYPFGQRKITYYTGPMFMYSNRITSMEYYDPITGIYMFNEEDHNFTSAYVMNGFKLNFNQNLGINFSLGLGFLMDNDYEEDPNGYYYYDQTIFHALGEISLYYRFK
jgi:hypothetical protein